MKRDGIDNLLGNATLEHKLLQVLAMPCSRTTGCTAIHKHRQLPHLQVTKLWLKDVQYQVAGVVLKEADLRVVKGSLQRLAQRPPVAQAPHIYPKLFCHRRHALPEDVR